MAGLSGSFSPGRNTVFLPHSYRGPSDRAAPRIGVGPVNSARSRDCATRRAPTRQVHPIATPCEPRGAKEYRHGASTPRYSVTPVPRSRTGKAARELPSGSGNRTPHVRPGASVILHGRGGEWKIASNQCYTTARGRSGNAIVNRGQAEARTEARRPHSRCCHGTREGPNGCRLMDRINANVFLLGRVHTGGPSAAGPTGDRCIVPALATTGSTVRAGGRRRSDCSFRPLPGRRCPRRSPPARACP